MTDAKNILKKKKLRPTIQRVAIVDYIIEKHKVHITAAKLIKYLKSKNINISLATIYNNLNELADKGILKKFYVNNDKMWFDTNLQDHYHFYDSEKDELIDIDKNEISFLSHLKFLMEKSRNQLI